jgi:hypothetical protein
LRLRETSGQIHCLARLMKREILDWIECPCD